MGWSSKEASPFSFYSIFELNQKVMEIINSTTDDIDAIFDFYDDAVALQKLKFNKHWQGFDRTLVEKEINENRQFKMVVDEVIVCIFAITFNDEAIWKDRDKSPSIYIHRIVTKPGYRGNNYVKIILEWALQFGKENDKQFVRMDTWGDNQKLIDYYQGCGFTFLGLSDVISDSALPTHYQGIQLSLFEKAI